jgi:hypothetical protein
MHNLDSVKQFVDYVLSNEGLVSKKMHEVDMVAVSKTGYQYIYLLDIISYSKTVLYSVTKNDSISAMSKEEYMALVRHINRSINLTKCLMLVSDIIYDKLSSIYKIKILHRDTLDSAVVMSRTPLPQSCEVSVCICGWSFKISVRCTPLLLYYYNRYNNTSVKIFDDAELTVVSNKQIEMSGHELMKLIYSDDVIVDNSLSELIIQLRLCR